MNKFETVVLSVDEFGDSLWDKVADLLQILTEAEYTCQVCLEEEGIVRIDYNYSEACCYGNATPHWLYPEEVEILDFIYNDILSEKDD